MITYLAKRGFEDPFGVFLEQWDGPQSIRVMTYEDLAAADAVPHGPLVFTDIERLTDADRVLAAHVRRIASEADPDLVILNDPVDTAARFAFLEEAAQQLGNPVRAYRVSERTRPQRYPVFVRYEDDHTGATTELVHSAKELDRALVECVLRGHDLRRLLIVEFVDTRSVAGEYIKYSAFIVGDKIQARSRQVSDHWMVKAARIRTPEHDAASLEFMRTNPHREGLRPYFEVADVSYGRIDYSMLGGEIVAWEINTNPVVVWPLAWYEDMYLARQREFLGWLTGAFQQIDVTDGREEISLSGVPSEVRAAVLSGPRPGHRSTRSRLVRWGRRHRGRLEPVVGVVAGATRPMHATIIDRFCRSSPR